jgi:serine phosphatase RsbU (regulator of sigma subunit)
MGAGTGRRSSGNEGWFLPPDHRRLLIGLLLALVGPIVVTPLARLDALMSFPALPYVLVVVIATVFGRLLAATVATVVSVVLLDRFFVDSVGDFGLQRSEDVWAFAIFILVALVVAQILVRLDRTAGASGFEHDRLAFLSRAGDALSGPLDLETALTQLGGVLVPTLADWFSVDLLEDGEIRNAIVIHPDPEKVELAMRLQRTFPSNPEAPNGAPNVIRTGKPELTETITEEMIDALVDDPALRETIRELGLRCAMVLPLTARGRTLGALTLIGAESHERYGPDDLRLAEEIADRAALAIDTAALFEAQRKANEAATAEAHRNAVLTEVTAAFGRATTVDEVMSAMLERGIRLAGAAAGTVGLLSERRVELVGIAGYETDEHPYWHSFTLDERLPMTDAITDARPVVISTTQQRDRLYPSLAGRGEQRDHALVCLPLLLGTRVIGGFSASYPPGTDFGAGDLAFLRAIGEQCAQAIDRARSNVREQATRDRFDALARASRGLARTLDFAATATTVVRLAVEHLGERASLFILAEGDPSGVRVVDGSGTTDVDADIIGAIEEAIEQGRPQLIGATDDEGDPKGIVLSLAIAESRFGALVVMDPRRDFRRSDELEFAREMARRMARAMENARLYRERDHVAKTLQQSLLPPTLPEVPGLEIEALFMPALRGYEVGGDFYDVFERSDGRWVAVIGDVCGKGVEAAALTGLARHTLRAFPNVERPSQALSALNRTMLRERLNGRFCTVAYVMIDPRPAGGARLTLASGGHPLPHHVGSDGRVDAVGRPGTLLGVIEDPRLEDDELTLEGGGSLVLFTDGILRKSDAFGDEPGGFVHALAGSPGASAKDLRRDIEGYVRGLVADGQDDDIAVLILRAR